MFHYFGNYYKYSIIDEKLFVEFTNADQEYLHTLVYERDTSATEVITLSPPTGSGLLTWKLQVIAATTAGLAIIAGGIILIKKKILK